MNTPLPDFIATNPCRHNFSEYVSLVETWNALSETERQTVRTKLSQINIESLRPPQQLKEFKQIVTNLSKSAHPDTF